ncbi:MAG: hypothetical protein ACR2GQ_11455 [Gemmatimonadota bacterium]
MTRATLAILMLATLNGCAGKPERPAEPALEAIAILPFGFIGEESAGEIAGHLETSFRSHAVELGVGPIMPTQAVEQYRGYKTVDADEIQTELRAKCQVEGIVSTKGEQIRFTMQVRGLAGQIVGAETLVYDRGTRHDVDVVAEMAESIRLKRCVSDPGLVEGAAQDQL